VGHLSLQQQLNLAHRHAKVARRFRYGVIGLHLTVHEADIRKSKPAGKKESRRRAKLKARPLCRTTGHKRMAASARHWLSSPLLSVAKVAVWQCCHNT